MTLPLLARYSDLLRYDRARGLMLALDLRVYPHEMIFVECAGVEAVVHAIEQGAVPGGPAIAYAAGYGLALAARAWRRRPSDVQRAAIIQTAERLRQVVTSDPRRIIEQCLACADAAILAGTDAEAAIADVVEGEVGRGDKVTERCGRNAAGLLDDGDRILTHGFAGAALVWMLYVAHVEQGRQIQLYVTEARPGLEGARLTAHQALAIGVPVTLLTDSAPGFGFARGLFTIYVAGAIRIARDGSVAAPIGTYQCAVLARRHHVPFYVLAHDGPDPATPTGADLAIAEHDPTAVLTFAGTRIAPEGAGAFAPACDVTPPELISAIVTHRGIYRPERIAGNRGP
jgi:methylthioribose-1-phosphate isomerase